MNVNLHYKFQVWNLGMGYRQLASRQLASNLIGQFYYISFQWSERSNN